MLSNVWHMSTVETMCQASSLRSKSIYCLLHHRDHEWCKHGTCSGMSDEHTYFRTVLDYFENGMQFGGILQNQGIVPSEDRQYSVS